MDHHFGGKMLGNHDADDDDDNEDKENEDKDNDDNDTMAKWRHGWKMQ